MPLARQTTDGFRPTHATADRKGQDRHAFSVFHTLNADSEYLNKLAKSVREKLPEDSELKTNLQQDDLGFTQPVKNVKLHEGFSNAHDNRKAMWVARLKVWHADSYVAEKTKDMDAGMASVYLNTFDQDGRTYLSRVALLYGPDAEKLVDFFKKDTRLKVEEVIGRQVFFTMPITNVFHPLLMDRGVFFIKPVTAEKGIEFWTVGAYRKQELKRLYEKINALKPQAGAEWISLRKERLDLFAQNAFERLSPKQRWAFERACAAGYYTYPRQTDLQSLAALLRVPTTTLRIHLRKAEAKLMPALGQALHYKND